jgi:hypothetical protein
LSRDISADDYPGRYLKNGTLNPDIPHSVAHSWVRQTVKYWMQRGMRTIAVHNVFASTGFIERYIEMAQHYGYQVHVIHCEAVIRKDGKLAPSSHGVPDSVQQRWIAEWEGWRSGKK